MVTPVPQGCPHPDDPDQQNINQSVYDSQSAHAQKNVDLANLKAAIDAANQQWDDGNMDGAYMTLLLVALPAVTTVTMDDQNCYAYDENTAAAVNAMETNCYNLELKGANYHVNDDGSIANDGMTPEDGQAFFNKQDDLLWDVTTTQWSWEGSDQVYQGNFVSMPDLTASQIRDASVDTMSNQYGFEVAHGSYSDSYVPLVDTNLDDVSGEHIANDTNSWWTTNDGKDPVGADKNALPQQLTSISQDFGTVNNCANGQEQSANSNLQQSINETNTYVGDINSDYGSFADEMKGITQNQKA